MTGPRPDSCLGRGLRSNWRSALIAIAALACGPVPSAPTTRPSAPASHAPGPVGPARLVASELQHDFGDVIAGERLRHAFALQNAGATALAIAHVRSSCSCTSAELRVEDTHGWRAYALGEPIPAGARLELATTFEPLNLDQESRTHVTLVQEDGELTRLELSARARPYFDVEPGLIDFGLMTTVERRELRALVRARRGEHFALREQAPVAVRGLTVALAASGADESGRAEEWEVRVRFGPDARGGPQVFPLHFQSDVPVAGVGADPERFYPARVIVRADVRTPVSAQPAFVSFGRIPRGVAVLRTIEVRSHDPEFQLALPERVQLVGPNGPSDAFPWAEHISARVLAANGGYDIELRVGPDLSADAATSFRGQVWIEVGHPAVDVLSVPLFGSLASSPGAAVDDG